MKDNQLFTPINLNDLLQEISNHHEYILVAGGTDLLINRDFFKSQKKVIDLSGINELKSITINNDSLIIGSLCTMTQIEKNHMVRENALCLAQAARSVGSWQIRNMATLGGNIANASPAADTPAALAALDAQVLLQSKNGQRSLPIEKFFTALNKSDIQTGEIIHSIYIPIKNQQISAFAKVGSRSEVTISRLNIAVAIDYENLQIKQAKVFMGTLGTPTLKANEAEQVLLEHGLNNCQLFAESLQNKVAEAIAGRSTMDYKKSAAKALAEDILLELNKEKNHE